jgi:hypothetical protein
LFAAFSRQWLVNSSRYVEVGFGLFSNQECSAAFGGLDDEGTSAESRKCRERSNSELIAQMRERRSGEKMTSSAFAPLGKVTFVIILLTVAGLLGAAGLALARKPLDLPIAPTSIALLGGMVGLITGCVFVATKPGPPGMVGVGLSFWMFGVGCVSGIVGAQMLAKVNRPPDPDWADDPIQPEPS